MLHRCSDHYYGLVPTSPRVNRPSKTYDGDFLRSLRPAASKISRNTRKKLFKLFIWRPYTPNPTLSTECVAINADAKSEPKLRNSCGEVSQLTLHNIRASYGYRPLPLIDPQRVRTLTTVKCTTSCDVKPAKLSNMCLLNTRSIKNKAPFIKDFIVDNDIDFMGINETWLDSGDKHKHVIKDVLPNGFKLHHTPLLVAVGVVAMELFIKRL